MKKALDILKALKKEGFYLEINWIDKKGIVIDKQMLCEAIVELEIYKDDMDSYLDYTTGSRCSKSFNSCLPKIKQAHDNYLEHIIKDNK